MGMWGLFLSPVGVLAAVGATQAGGIFVADPEQLPQKPFLGLREKAAVQGPEAIALLAQLEEAMAAVTRPPA